MSLKPNTIKKYCFYPNIYKVKRGNWKKKLSFFDIQISVFILSIINASHTEPRYILPANNVGPDQLVSEEAN